MVVLYYTVHSTVLVCVALCPPCGPGLGRTGLGLGLGEAGLHNGRDGAGPLSVSLSLSPAGLDAIAAETRGIRQLADSGKVPWVGTVLYRTVPCRE